MPEIVPPVESVPVEKKRRGRPPGLGARPKAKAEPRPRGVGAIEAAFGERGRIASRILPAEQRKALIVALKAKGADTTRLRERLGKLTVKLEAIQNSAEIVEAFRVKLRRIADTIAGDETHE